MFLLYAEVLGLKSTFYQNLFNWFLMDHNIYFCRVSETDPTLSFEPQVLTRHQFAKYVCNRRSKRAEIIYKEAVVVMVVGSSALNLTFQTPCVPSPVTA